MPAVPFPDLPDDARLWVFGASRPLNGAEEEALLHRVDGFVEQWAAHGRPVAGARDWRDGHFLLVAADEHATGVSGCSIDSLFHLLGEVERDLGVPLRDGSRVWYRDAAGQVHCLTRDEFRERVRTGEVADDTPVFDQTANTIGALRAGGWERPFSESWHARAFPRD